MTTHGLFVNKEMFEANNAVIPEDGFWTYEEFVSELEKVTNINTGTKG